MNRIDRPHPYLEVSRSGDGGPWEDVYCSDRGSFVELSRVHELGDGDHVYVFFSKNKDSVYRVCGPWNRWRTPNIDIIELSMFGHKRAGKVERVNWFIRTEKMEKDSPGLVNSKQPDWLPHPTLMHEGMKVAILMYESGEIMKIDKISRLDFRRKKGAVR